MALFDQSWYQRVLVERIEGLTPKAAWRAAYQDILDFERMLADDGTVLIKFFFHIAKKEQRKRFRKLRQDPLEAWRVDQAALRQHRKYEEYLEAVEEMLELTESEFAPWTIVEATSRWWARKKVFDTIIAALERRLGEDAPSREAAGQAAEREADLRQARRTLEAEHVEES
jgi:polyphosphate kinase 2 (PPK2 family)